MPEMSLSDKIKFIYEERYPDLDAWERDFISDIYANVQDPDEEMTRRQIEKVEEIWENLGL